jgi:hypothetical protein
MSTATMSLAIMSSHLGCIVMLVVLMSHVSNVAWYDVYRINITMSY